MENKYRLKAGVEKKAKRGSAGELQNLYLQKYQL